MSGHCVNDPLSIPYFCPPNISLRISYNICVGMAILNSVLLATVWSREPVYSPHAPCARASLGARETRPYGREQQRIHTAVEPGAWNAYTERERRWTERDRSERAEPGPLSTRLHLPNSRRLSSECCPGWVFQVLLCTCDVCVAVCAWEREGGPFCCCCCVSPVTCSQRKYRS